MSLDWWQWGLLIVAGLCIAAIWPPIFELYCAIAEGFASGAGDSNDNGWGGDDD